MSTPKERQDEKDLQARRHRDLLILMIVGIVVTLIGIGMSIAI